MASPNFVAIAIRVKGNSLRYSRSLFLLLIIQGSALAQSLSHRAIPLSEQKDLVIYYADCGKPLLDDRADPNGNIRAIVKPILSSIKQAWASHVLDDARYPKGQKFYTYVHFTVLPEGKLGPVTIDSSSGDKVMDEAVLISIRTANFLSFPSAGHLQSMTLHTTFLVNMTCDEVIADEAKKTSPQS